MKIKFMHLIKACSLLLFAVVLTACNSNSTTYEAQTLSLTPQVASRTENTSSVQVENLTAAAISLPATIPIYRLYNPNNGDHLYTPSKAEYLALGPIGWRQEKISFYAYGGAVEIDSETSLPWLRVYNPNSGLHHWTISLGEYNYLGSIGWRQEGPSGYIFENQVTGSVPLFRVYNPNNGTHHWTLSAGEKNVLVSLGWRDEGIAGYVFKIFDVEAPVITLNGDSTIIVNLNSSFTDPGATATDNIDTSVSVISSGSVNTAVIGTYTITYNATDSALNSAIPVTRNIIVNDIIAAPHISNLDYSPKGAFLNDGGGFTTITGNVDFTDPNGDIASYVLTIYDSKSNVIEMLSAPVLGAGGITSGTALFSVLVNTTVVDDYTFAIYLNDSNNNTSNTLGGLFSVVGIKQITSNMPDTGVDKCYDLNNIINCPPLESDPFYGQDYHYSSNPMSFTNNGDGTITDNVTSLMWQRTPDGHAYNWYEATGTYDVVNNPASTDVCGGLTVGGYEDWRLPKKPELQSIVDYGVVNPAIDTTFFPDTSIYNYWSSTEYEHKYIYDSTDSWYVQFTDGSVRTDNKAIDKNVHCVRGATWGMSVYVDNSDGTVSTVSDTGSGLMWQKTGQGSGNDWQEMLGVCTGLELAGYSDWRLPDIKELATIANAEAFLEDIPSALFCSSTTIADDYDSVWVMMFSPSNPSYVNGEIFQHAVGHSKSSCSVFYSRCVR